MQERKFKMEDYEPVKSRKKRFYEKYADGRIIVECIEASDKGAIFKATLYKNADEQAKGLAFATGFAQEFKGQGSFANKTSWTENCEESAIGRALDNAGFSGNNKCSREEIEKVERGQAAEPEAAPQPTELAEDGSFVIPFGKFKDKTIADIPAHQLRSYINFLLGQTKTTGKPLTDGAQALISNAMRHLDKVAAL